MHATCHACLLYFCWQVSVVAEQLLRLLHHCGMPKTDVDFLVGPGTTMGEVLSKASPRSTLFTGSQRVAERLAVQLHGKVRTICSKTRHAYAALCSEARGSVCLCMDLPLRPLCA